MVELRIPWAVTAEESSLVQRAQDGDEAAFEELIERSQQRLYTLAARLLNSPSEAQDVIQEAYLAAYTHLHQLDPRRSPLAWLTTVTTRLCLNRLRSRKRLSPVELESLSQLLSYHPRPEQQIALQQALASLSEEHRAVVLLYYGGGYSCGEIAAMLERGESAIKVSLLRSRERLRKYLEPS